MKSRQHAARVAGVLYLLLIVTAAFSLTYIPSAFIVPGDAAATAQKIVSSQMLYRIGIVIDLAANIIFVFLVVALYELLKDVNKRHAVLMLALALVQVPMAFGMMLFQSAPLILLSGADYLSVFDKPQLEALAMGFLRLRDQGIQAVMALWGLWLLPFGLLVFRSGFIPRIIGVLLIVTCFAYLAVSLTYLLFPAYGLIANQLMTLPFAAGVLSIMLWLLIKGARPEPSEDQPSESGNRVAVDV